MIKRLIPRAKNWHPPPLTPDYKTTIARAPRQPFVTLPAAETELTGPTFGHGDVGPLDHDLTRNFSAEGEPIGPRIIVHGRVTDENARPVPETLIEIWQANAGGRYRHMADTYLAPLDPHFGGGGRTLTDENGHYEFLTIRPGAYPWPNAGNSWRPAHIHFSVFGTAFAQRLITQMYFEGDPLIALCPIAQSIPDPRAVERLIAPLDMEATLPFDAMAYRFDIVLRGWQATHFENQPEGT
ncbi:protocatechuate 3,4-dioxygenase subunit beta [Yoonia sp. 2307UL14-13]|uniref:protocatechuate 3,4-dioxygenase subunit beta n=1 Tax=Yoonia sp. 2307UL14-13 TaxID=3126506 RepID=UPI00309C5290